MNRFLEKDQMALSVFKQALPFKLIRNSVKTSSNIQSELDNSNWFSEEMVFPCSLPYTDLKDKAIPMAHENKQPGSPSWGNGSGISSHGQRLYNTQNEKKVQLVPALIDLAGCFQSNTSTL